MGWGGHLQIWRLAAIVFRVFNAVDKTWTALLQCKALCQELPTSWCIYVIKLMWKVEELKPKIPVRCGGNKTSGALKGGFYSIRFSVIYEDETNASFLLSSPPPFLCARLTLKKCRRSKHLVRILEKLFLL